MGAVALALSVKSFKWQSAYNIKMPANRISLKCLYNSEIDSRVVNP